eukprot:13874011-Alexandrium_andersonii.AAC.1
MHLSFALPREARARAREFQVAAWRPLPGGGACRTVDKIEVLTHTRPLKFPAGMAELRPPFWGRRRRPPRRCR